MTEDEEDDIEEIVMEEGERVYDHYWETSSWTNGADHDYIYEYQGKYYSYNLYVFNGPFDNLVEAIEESGIGEINNATQYINTILPTDDVIPLLFTYCLDPDEIGDMDLFTVNGVKVRMNVDRTFSRAE